MAYVDKFYDIEKEIEKAQDSDRRRLARFLKHRDEEIEQERQWAKRNMCPHCHVTLTTTGVCINDCGYVKPKEVNQGNDRTKKIEGVKTRGTITQTKVNPGAIKAEDLQALLDIGFTLQQALEKLAKEAPNVDKTSGRPKEVWTYQGDHRCPICGKYSKLYTKGQKGKEEMRLTCSKHGVMIKKLGEVWKSIS